MPRGLKPCSKAEPCPACGAESWCAWFTGPDDCHDGRWKFLCMKQAVASDAEADLVAMPVAGYKAARKPGKSGGVVYRPVGAGGEVHHHREPTPDERAADEAKKARWRAKNRRDAAAVWRAAERQPPAKGGVGHARAAAYVEFRGVPVAQLALGKLPPSLAYHPACPRELFDEAGKAISVERRRSDGSGGTFSERARDFVPALVCAMFRYGEDDEGKVRPYVAAVQRIFLDPRPPHEGGEPGKRPSSLLDGPGMQGDKGKMAKGDMGGAFVPLAPRRGEGAGTLVLCEGVETGLAIAAATWRGRETGGPGVWACVSTSGLKNLELHPAVFSPPSQGEGKLSRVIIAADYDEWKKSTRHRPGPTDARIAANRIAKLCPWLRVEVATPSMGVAPTLIGEVGSDPHDGGDEDGAKILSGGKTVDWLDVYVAGGAEAVERGVMGGGAVASAAGGAPVPSRDQGEVTRERPSVPEGGAGGGGGSAPVVGADDPPPRKPLSDNPAVVAMAYLWDQCLPPAGAGRRFTLARWRSNWYEWIGTQWAVIPEEVLDARLWAWCSGFDHVRELKTRTKVAPFHVKRELVSAVRSCLVAHVSVLSETTPVWLPPVLPEEIGAEDAAGRCLWGSTVAPGGPRPYARPEMGDVLGFANGWVSLGEMVRDRTCTLYPHTTDYFGGASAPYALPVDAVRRMLEAEDAGAIEAVYRDVCPTWAGLLETWGAGDADWGGVLQLMFGDALRTDRGMEKVFLLVGPQRSGKTTVVDIGLMGVVGAEAFAAINYTTFENRFGFAPLVNKRVAAMGDAEFGKHDDPGRIVEGIKLVSGQSMVIIEEKGKPSYTARLGCRVWITSNTVPSQLRDSSSALAGRFVILPFRKSFMGREDSSIKREKLPAELPGIAVWAIEGAVRLASMPEPKIDMTERGREIHDEFVLSSSPLLKYMTDRCWWGGSDPPARPEACVLVSDLHKDYQEWAENEGLAALSLGRFGHELRAVIPDLQMKQPEAWGRKRVYYGIELRPKPEPSAMGTVYEHHEYGGTRPGF